MNEHENGAPVVVPMSCTMRASSLLVGKMGAMAPPPGPVNVGAVLDDLTAVEALGGLMTRALAAHPDDMNHAAAFVLAEMRRNQR